MECSSNMSKGAWTPHKSPLTWTLINLACLIWSLILVLDIILVDEDLEDRPRATKMYLVWNFGTTVIWCVEVGLKQLVFRYGYNDDDNDNEHSYKNYSPNHGGDNGGGGDDGIMASSSSSGPSQQTRLERFLDHWVVRWIEVGLAIFFLVDSFRLLYKWRLKHGDLEAELGEAILNVFAYSFISYESWILYQRQRRRRRDFVDLEAGSTPGGGGNFASSTISGSGTGLLWDEKNQRAKKPTSATNDGPLELPYGTSI